VKIEENIYFAIFVIEQLKLLELIEILIYGIQYGDRFFPY
jgi:hypothetical protein